MLYLLLFMIVAFALSLNSKRMMSTTRYGLQMQVI